MTSSLLALFVALSLPSTPAMPALPALAAYGVQAQDAKTAAPAQTVNVNTGSVQQFEALPGIGPSMAQRIVSYREKNGPFKKLEDLMNVQGIGEKSFLKLRPHLTLGTQADAKPAKD